MGKVLFYCNLGISAGLRGESLYLLFFGNRNAGPWRPVCSERMCWASLVFFCWFPWQGAPPHKPVPSPYACWVKTFWMWAHHLWRGFKQQLTCKCTMGSFSQCFHSKFLKLGKLHGVCTISQHFPLRTKVRQLASCCRLNEWIKIHLVEPCR